MLAYLHCVFACWLLVSGGGCLLLPSSLATCEGWHLGNPRAGVQPHRLLSLFLVEERHAREELRCGSSHPCVPGTRFLRYALTDLVPPGAVPGQVK